MPRIEFDPKKAFLVEIHCDKCNMGGKGGDSTFFDKSGTGLDWETGKPYAAASKRRMK